MWLADFGPLNDASLVDQTVALALSIREEPGRPVFSSIVEHVRSKRTLLDDRFRFLTGGSRTALPRQQTLRALIDWSYELLSEAERKLFRRLSVVRWRVDPGARGNGVRRR